MSEEVSGMIIAPDTPNFMIGSWSLIQSFSLEDCCVPSENIMFDSSDQGVMTLIPSNWIGGACSKYGLSQYPSITLEISSRSTYLQLSNNSVNTNILAQIYFTDFTKEVAYPNRSQKVEASLLFNYRNAKIPAGECRISISKKDTFVIPEEPGKPFLLGITSVSSCPREKPFTDGSICIESCPMEKNFVVGSTCVEKCLTTLPLLDGNYCVAECPINKLYIQNSIYCVTLCDENARSCKFICPQDKPFSFKGTCVAQCPESTLFLENAVSCTTTCTPGLSCKSLCPDGKSLIYNNNCVSHCPATAPYIQESIFCVERCDGKDCRLACPPDSPYFYKEKCISKCPVFADGDTCTDSCPRERQYIEDGICKAQCSKNKPYSDQNICVKSCSKTNPFIYTRDTTYLCVENCLKDKPYNYKRKCVSSCPEKAPVLEGSSCISGQPETYNNFIESSQAVGEVVVSTAAITVLASQPGSSSVAYTILLFKMIQYVRYLSINFPTKVAENFQEVKLDTSSYNVVPGFSQHFIAENAQNFKANIRFARYDVNALFIINFSSGIATFIVFAIIASSILFLINKLKPTKPRYIHWQEKANIFFKWNLPILFILSNVDNISTFALIEFQSLSLQHIIAIISLVFNIICISGSVLLLFYLLKTVYSVRKRDKDLFRLEDTYMHRIVKALFKDIKKKYFIQQIALFIVAFRVILHNLIILGWDTPLQQSLFLCLLNLLMIIYIITFKPHVYTAGNVELLGFELIILSVNMCCVYLSALEVLEQDQADKIGEIIFFCNFLIKTFAMFTMGWKTLMKVKEYLYHSTNSEPGKASLVNNISMELTSVN